MFLRRGLTNALVLRDRAPRGCLFWVKNKGVEVGYFDLDGFWCVPKGDRRVEVRRGASRAVNRLCTEAQRFQLAKARLQARRKGVR